MRAHMSTTHDAEHSPLRSRSPYSKGERLARLGWAVVQALLFRPSFHNCYAWRRLLLRAFGADLARVVRIRRTVVIECPWNLKVGNDSAVGDRAILYCLGPVVLGDRVTISQGAHLCAGTHDFRQPSMPLIRAGITVQDDVWICADAFVGPGVTVGHGAILGACGVAIRSLAPWTIFRGNPAVPIGPRPPLGDMKPDSECGRMSEK